MKNNRLVFAVLALFSAAPAAPAAEDVKAFEKKLEDYVKESREAKAACDRYLQELEKAARTEEKNGEPFLANKAAALAVLNKLREHPGVPKAAKEALKMATGKLPPGVNQEWFMKTLSSAQYFCGMRQYNDHMKMLFDASARFGFGEAEKEQLKKLTIKFIDGESSYPCTLTSVLTQLRFLFRMTSDGLLSSYELKQEAVMELSVEANKVKEKIAAEMGDQGKLTPELQFKAFMREMMETNKLRARIHWMVEEL